MEGKKAVKISLGTAICIFIIILLVVALGVVYYLGFVKNKNTEPLSLKPNTASNIEQNKTNNLISSNNDNQVNGNKTDIVEDNQENSNKCYTDGKYYYLMLYKTYLGTKNSKIDPSNEERRFCLIVNNGYGNDELYGWYNIENSKINLVLSTSYDYNIANNVANMMTKGNNVKVKDENGQYIITLDYSEEIIKYGEYDLKLQKETQTENSNKCYTDGKYYYLMLYKTYLGTKNSKIDPSNEERRFCMIVNNGYGNDELY